MIFHCHLMFSSKTWIVMKIKLFESIVKERQVLFLDLQNLNDLKSFDI